MVDIWAVLSWFCKGGSVLDIPVPVIWGAWIRCCSIQICVGCSARGGCCFLGDGVGVEDTSANEQAVHGCSCLFCQGFIEVQSPCGWEAKIACLALTTAVFCLQIAVVHICTHDIDIRVIANEVNFLKWCGPSILFTDFVEDMFAIAKLYFTWFTNKFGVLQLCPSNFLL